MEQFFYWFEILAGTSPAEFVLTTIFDLYVVQFGGGQMPEHAGSYTKPHKAHVVHHSPGRLRLRVAGKRGDKAFFDEVAEKARNMPSVRRVQTNPATGSILVTHDAGDSLPTLVGEAFQAGLQEFIDVEMPEAKPFLPIATQLVERAFHMDKGIKNASRGAIDGQSAVVGGLLVAAVIQIARGQWLGPAVPLIWYAAQAVGMMPTPTAIRHDQ